MELCLRQHCLVDGVVKFSGKIPNIEEIICNSTKLLPNFVEIWQEFIVFIGNITKIENLVIETSKKYTLENF